MGKFKWYVIIGALVAGFAACRPWRVVSQTGTYYPMRTDSVGIDSTIYKLLQPYKTILERTMNDTLCQSQLPLSRAQPEGLLNNFVADALRTIADTTYKPTDGKPIDCVLLNYGGLRASLPQGAITLGNVFELMPFDNGLCVITIPGDSLLRYCQYSAFKGGDPVSGLSFGITEGKYVNALINGQPIIGNQTYKVLTSDYLANGGDKMSFFTRAIKTECLPLLLRDALIAYCKGMGKQNIALTATLNNRIYYAK